MNRQTAQQTQQESTPRQKQSLFRHHASVRPVVEAEYERLSDDSSTGFDLTQVPVQSSSAEVNQNVPRSCPVPPQRCPFGGACHSCPPRVQAKLKIGQPGDKYEQEADRVAEQVMRMPEPSVQRKRCSSPGCKEEDEDKILQAKSVGSAGNVGSQVDYPLIKNVLSSPGQPLDAPTRSFMEPRFGHDFSRVRVHTDGKAAESARAVNARAYTVGQDVVFGEGEYSSDAIAERKLFAHELTHVVQQNGRSIFPFAYNNKILSESSEPLLQRRRLTEEEKDQNLTSPQLAGNARLQTAFDNEPPMRRGEEGEAVALVQQVLLDDGYSMPRSTENGMAASDGVFGRETQQTVRWFQRKYDLSVDGNVGRETLQKMDELFGGIRPPLNTTPEVDATQEALAERTLAGMNRANERGRRNPNSGVWYDHQYERMSRQSPDLYRWDEDYRRGYANPRYFDRLDYWDWRLKPNVSASEGIRAWLRGLTIAECFTVVIASQYEAIRAAVGDTDFDEQFGSTNRTLSQAQRLRIAPPPESENIPLVNFQTETEAARSSNEGRINNRPVQEGEWYYIANHPNYQYKHPEGAWQGENALYVGRNRAGQQLWTGFGAANMTENRMYNKMVRLYNLPRTNRDYMTIVNWHTKPSQEITADEMNAANHNYRALYHRYLDRIKDDYRHDLADSFEDRITTRKLLDEGGGFDVSVGTTLDVARVRALRGP